MAFSSLLVKCLLRIDCAMKGNFETGLFRAGVGVSLALC